MQQTQNKSTFFSKYIYWAAVKISATTWSPINELQKLGLSPKFVQIDTTCCEIILDNRF